MAGLQSEALGVPFALVAVLGFVEGADGREEGGGGGNEVEDVTKGGGPGCYC